jgi:hypothetical protein
VSARETAYYLYCMAPPGGALEFAQAGVFVEDAGAARAVLSEVRREEFCGESAEERLQDLAWLAPRVSWHEAVVERVMEQSPVLPAPFATLFESLESVRGFLLGSRDPIAGFFRDLGGKREWSVKGMLDRTVTSENLTPALGEQSPGIKYLAAKRSQAASKEARSQWLRAVCEQAAGELRQQAPAFRERRVWKAGGPSDAIFNWAFLLPAGEEGDFRQRIARLDERHGPLGLNFVVTGPWPPYSFAPALGRPAETEEPR